MKNAPVSLQQLEDRFFALEGKINKAEIAARWEQGRILKQMQPLVKKEGSAWEAYVETRLHITAQEAVARIKAGALPSLPTETWSDGSPLTFGQVAAIAVWYEKSNKSSVDEVAKSWIAAEEEEARKRKPDPIPPKDSGKKKRAPRPMPIRGMTLAQAFAEIGITGDNISITEEALGILFRALRQKRHPDKGGDNAAFLRLTKAMEVIQANGAVRNVA